MFKLYDMVKAASDIYGKEEHGKKNHNKLRVFKGTKGTIVEIYEESSIDYMVEFFNDGKTIDVLLVDGSDIERYTNETS